MATNVKHAPMVQDPVAPKGWRIQVVGPDVLFVKLGFRAERCTGEAHSNAYIDNCGVCLNHCWGYVAVALPKIEGYGVKGLKSTPWRRTFKNEDQMWAWLEKNDALLHGSRLDTSCE